jgi:SAM-dependent methyltransferase
VDFLSFLAKLSLKPQDRASKVREVWNSPEEHYEIQGFKIYWETLSEVARYQFEMVSGDPTIDLHSYTVSLVRERQQGVSGKALVLGCLVGPFPPEVAFAESGLFDQVTCLDIADGLLAEQAKATAERGQGRISYKCVDLNTALLDGGPYDLVWSQGTIHHIQALEHLFSQVSRTLSDRGMFVIREYVGSPWIQFSERQARIVNRLMPYIPERFRTTFEGQVCNKLIRPTSEEIRAMDPSESPRSHEIVPLLRKFFNIARLCETGGSLLFPLLGGVAGNYEQSPEGSEFLRLLIGFERVLIEEGILAGDYIFAVATRK